MTIPSRIPCERVVRIGGENGVLGIATDPATIGVGGHGSASMEPVVVFLNAGVLHRVGPNRLHVSLARRLSVCGFGSLRLDLSGIGDSRGVPGELTFRESAVADTRGAMDELQRSLGVGKFVLFGLCSGAENALATADVDPRVAGLVLVNPPAYPNLRSRIRFIGIRLRKFDSVASGLTWAAVKAVVRGRRALLLHLARRIGTEPGKSDDEPAGRIAPPKGEYRALLSRLANRGVHVLAAYSADNRERYNTRNQLFEVFPELRGRVDVAFYANSNHVFTPLDQQEALMRRVSTWLIDHFPRSA